MPAYHKVQSGECLSSLAKRYGFTDYRALYEDPKNAQLKKQRSNPNILLPNDCLYIPDKREKQEVRATSQQHTFQVTASNIVLRLQMCDEEQKPYAGKKYLLKAGPMAYRGCTGANGLIEQRVPADTVQAELTLWTDEDEIGEESVSFMLALGCLAPVEELTGVQARLNNLGYDCGPVDGICGPMTKAAVKAFQKANDLSVDGIPGRNTQAKLKEVYGC